MPKDIAAQEADEMMEPRSGEEKPPMDLGDDQVWPTIGPIATDVGSSPNE